MTKLKKIKTEQILFNEINGLIEESKKHVAYTVNAVLTHLYWKIGKRINIEVLHNKRAEYGKGIVATLSRQLTEQNRNGVTT